MDYVDVRKEIEMYLDTNFTSTPIQFENTIIAASSDSIEEFIALTISDASTETPAMGSTSSMVTGLLTVQVFTKLGTGTQRARTLYDELKTLLLGVTINGLSFKAPIHTSVGQVEESQHYQTNLDCTFEFIT